MDFTILYIIIQSKKHNTKLKSMKNIIALLSKIKRSIKEEVGSENGYQCRDWT